RAADAGHVHEDPVLRLAAVLELPVDAAHARAAVHAQALRLGAGGLERLVVGDRRQLGDLLRRPGGVDLLGAVALDVAFAQRAGALLVLAAQARAAFDGIVGVGGGHGRTAPAACGHGGGGDG